MPSATSQSDNFCRQSPSERHTGPGPHQNISISNTSSSVQQPLGAAVPSSGGHNTNSWHGADTLSLIQPKICVTTHCGLYPLSTILWLPATCLPACTAALLHTVNIPYSQFRGKLRLLAPGRPGSTLGPAHFSPLRGGKNQF